MIGIEGINPFVLCFGVDSCKNGIYSEKSLEMKTVECVWVGLFLSDRKQTFGVFVFD